MSLTFTEQQIIEIVPNRKIKQAKTLVDPKYWSDLGCSDRAIWGVFNDGKQRSLVIVEKDNTSICDCPNRKSYCKHSLALMLLTDTPDSFTIYDNEAEPDFVKSKLKIKPFSASVNPDLPVSFKPEVLDISQDVVTYLNKVLHISFAMDLDLEKVDEKLKELRNKCEKLNTTTTLALRIEEMLNASLYSGILYSSDIAHYDVKEKKMHSTLWA